MCCLWDLVFSPLKWAQFPPSCCAPGVEVTGVSVLGNGHSQGRGTREWLFSQGEEEGAGRGSRARREGACGVLNPWMKGASRMVGWERVFFLWVELEHLSAALIFCLHTLLPSPHQPHPLLLRGPLSLGEVRFPPE